MTYVIRRPNLPQINCYLIERGTGWMEDEFDRWLLFEHMYRADFKRMIALQDIEFIHYFNLHNRVHFIIKHGDGMTERRFLYKFEWRELLERPPVPITDYAQMIRDGRIVVPFVKVPWKEEGF